MNIRLGKFNFLCDAVEAGFAVNPVLPKAFSDTANEARPERHMVWWDVPFIETATGDDPAWVAHWKGNTRYDVRCLDGGAWDRPTCWGMFATLAEAVQCAKSGPVWRKAVAA